MHGLDEYDSKARWYYPAICCTTTMDPLAEKYYPTSPYAWCGNNPIKHVDRNGKWIESAWDAANVVVQYDIDDTHINVEFDSKPINGNKHRQTILKNDPNAIVILKPINQ